MDERLAANIQRTIVSAALFVTAVLVFLVACIAAARHLLPVYPSAACAVLAFGSAAIGARDAERVTRGIVGFHYFRWQWLLLWFSLVLFFISVFRMR